MAQEVRRADRTNTGTQKSRIDRNSADRRGEYREYVYGTAVPKIDIKRQLEEVKPIHHPSQTTKNNRAKQYAWSLSYIVLLAVCMVLVGGMFLYRVKLEATMTSQVDRINSLEKQLNDLKMTNDEDWSRINNNIDLEEIKRIAIGELGMTYAQEGQIVTYTSEGMDYMRKVVED